MTDTPKADGGAALLPCPFCGCAMRLNQEPRHSYWGPEGSHKSVCLIANIDFADFADRNRAIKEWTARAPTPAPMAAGGEVVGAMLRSADGKLTGDPWAARKGPDFPLRAGESVVPVFATSPPAPMAAGGEHDAGKGALDPWRGLPLDLAPRDGTIVRLCVNYTDMEPWLPLEDANIAWTIGGNNFDNDGQDEWRFAGWSWQQDLWCEGKGKVIGWSPFDNSPPVARASSPTRAGDGELRLIGAASRALGYLEASPEAAAQHIAELLRAALCATDAGGAGK